MLLNVQERTEWIVDVRHEYQLVTDKWTFQDMNPLKHYQTQSYITIVRW